MSTDTNNPVVPCFNDTPPFVGPKLVSYLRADDGDNPCTTLFCGFKGDELNYSHPKFEFNKFMREMTTAEELGGVTRILENVAEALLAEESEESAMSDVDEAVVPDNPILDELLTIVDSNEKVVKHVALAVRISESICQLASKHDPNKTSPIAKDKAAAFFSAMSHMGIDFFTNYLQRHRSDTQI